MTTDSITADNQKTVDMADLPIGPRQIFIMSVASLGQFIGQ